MVSRRTADVHSYPWVHRLDQRKQALPGDDLFHLGEKLLATCLLALGAVLQIRKGQLVMAKRKK
ncbi:hypothetical protein DBV39_19280 [Orrella marina]|uniref:Uncharacterized protein n=1 Tax=Orrella marina TaxID=2163011 RepID=A0A2R4XP13_9BURK|nr:hypothetical protein DBV39_19280 [Orrella marina]